MDAVTTASHGESRSRFAALGAGILLLVATLIAYRDVVGPGRELFFRDHCVIYRHRWRVLVEYLFSGEWPALTRAHFGGAPLESLLNGTYTPGLLLFGLGDFDFIYDLFVAFHTFVLAAGACALTYALVKDWPQAIVTGLVAALAGPALSLENLLVILIGLAYAPWVYLALHRCLVAPRLDRFAVLAFVTAFHLQGITPILAFLDVAVAAWLVLHVRPRPSPRLLGGLVMASILALGMASMQLGPFLESLSETTRGRGFTYSERVAWSILPVEIGELFYPTLLYPRDKPYLHFGLHGPLGFAYFESYYFGSALVLIAFGFVASKRRTQIAVVAALLFLVLMCLGDATPVYRAVSEVWLLNRSRYPSKYVLLILPIAAALAGFGTRRVEKPSDTMIVVAGLASVVVASTWWFVRTNDFAELIAPYLVKKPAIHGLSPEMYPTLMSDHMASMGLHALVFFGALLLATAAARRLRLPARGVVVVIVGLDLAWAAGYAIVGVEAEPRTVPAEIDASVAHPYLRHYPTGNIPPAAPGHDETHFGDIARESRLRGYAPFDHGRRAGDLDWEGTSHPASETVFDLVAHSSRAGALDIMRRAGIRWIVRDRPSGTAPPVESEIAYDVPGSTPQYFTTIAAPQPYVAAYTDWSIEHVRPNRSEALTRAFAATSQRGAALLLRFDHRDDVTPEPPSTPCTETPTVALDVDATTETTIEAEVRTACPSVVVALEVQANGWRAEIDGAPAPLFHAEAGFLATLVSPGTHRVKFRYESRTPTYAMVAAAAALITLALFALGRRRRATIAVQPPTSSS